MVLINDGKTSGKILTVPKDVRLKINSALLKLKSIVDNATFQCSICLGTIKDTHVVSGCQHTFCGPCIKDSIRKCRNECPECRTPILTQRHLQKDSKHDYLFQEVTGLFILLKEVEVDLVNAGMSNCKNNDECTSSSGSDSNSGSDSDSYSNVASSAGKDIQKSVAGKKRKEFSSLSNSAKVEGGGKDKAVLMVLVDSEEMSPCRSKRPKMNISGNTATLTGIDALPERRVVNEISSSKSSSGPREESGRSRGRSLHSVRSSKSRNVIAHTVDLDPLILEFFSTRVTPQRRCKQLEKNTYIEYNDDGSRAATPTNEPTSEGKLREKSTRIEENDDTMSSTCQQHDIRMRSVDSREAKTTRDDESPVISGSGSSSSTTTSKPLSFEENLALLKEFKNQFGHTRATSQIGNYCDLDKFVTRMRQNYNNAHVNGLAGNTNALVEEQIQRLDEIGFEWTVNVTFDERMLELKEFKNKFGHCDVRKSDKSYIALSTWCCSLRTRYKQAKKDGVSRRIASKRIKQLNDIGFLWTVDIGPRQDLLGRFCKKLNKNASIDDGGDEFRAKTPTNVSTPRMKLREKSAIKEGNRGTMLSLCPDRTCSMDYREAKIKRGKRLPVKSGSGSGSRSHSCLVTSVSNASFEENLELLKAFKRSFGHTRVPNRRIYHNLYKFAITTRRRYKTAHTSGSDMSALAEEQIQQLEGIGFEWSVPGYRSFDERMLDLKDFKNEFGHCNVQSSFPKHIQLYKWCNHLRLAYKIFQKEGKTNRITPERIKRLNDIGFFWSVEHKPQQKRTPFNQRLVELEEFKNEFGHCDVRYTFDDHASLSKWCSKMRNSYLELQTKGKTNGLNFEKVERLNEMGFVWSPKKRLGRRAFKKRESFG